MAGSLSGFILVLIAGLFLFLFIKRRRALYTSFPREGILEVNADPFFSADESPSTSGEHPPFQNQPPLQVQTFNVLATIEPTAENIPLKQFTGFGKSTEQGNYGSLVDIAL